MGAYILENVSEGQRLETQNSHSNYSVAEELRDIRFNPFDKVLDAGCGTGAVTRFILENHSVKKVTAIDFSNERLAFNENLCKKITSKTKVEFFHRDLTKNLEFTEKFNVILSRFVLHHLSKPDAVVKNLANNLSENGELVVVDSDGIFFNMYSDDEWVQQKLEVIRNAIGVDMFVARKLKSYFHKAGLSKIESRIVTMHFTGDDLAFEREQYRERFQATTTLITNILGKSDTKRFFDRYLECLERPGTELFYSKFICRGRK